MKVSWVAVVALKGPLFNTLQRLIFLFIVCADLPSSCKCFRTVNSREDLSKQEWFGAAQRVDVKCSKTGDSSFLKKNFN